eukprot:6994962-Pyramimonas_sp.AAC.1
MSVLRVPENRNRSIEERQSTIDMRWRYFSQLRHTAIATEPLRSLGCWSSGGDAARRVVGGAGPAGVSDGGPPPRQPGGAAAALEAAAQLGRGGAVRGGGGPPRLRVAACQAYPRRARGGPGGAPRYCKYQAMAPARDFPPESPLECQRTYTRRARARLFESVRSRAVP